MKILFSPKSSDQFQSDLLAVGALVALILTSPARDNKFAKRWLHLLDQIYQDSLSNAVKKEYTLLPLEDEKVEATSPQH